MDYQASMKQMADDAQRIRALVEGVGDEQARWKPDAESWSILEVAGHLLEEERRDFRVRLDIMLHRPDEAWPPIDPAGWVTAHSYNEQDLSTTLAEFLEERAASLDWLAALDNPDWEAAYDTPWGPPPIRAGDMLAAWAAHDLLHMRQLVELHWAYNEKQIAPYISRYAG